MPNDMNSVAPRNKLSQLLVNRLGHVTGGHSLVRVGISWQPQHGDRDCAISVYLDNPPQSLVDRFDSYVRSTGKGIPAASRWWLSASGKARPGRDDIGPDGPGGTGGPSNGPGASLKLGACCAAPWGFSARASSNFVPAKHERSQHTDRRPPGSGGCNAGKMSPSCPPISSGSSRADNTEPTSTKRLAWCFPERQ